MIDLTCVICKQNESSATPKHCCSGKDCTCRGVDYIEGLPVCDECKEILEKLDTYDCGITIYNHGKKETVTLCEVAE